MNFTRIHTPLMHSQTLRGWLALFVAFSTCAFQGGAVAAIPEPTRVVEAAPEHVSQPQMLPITDASPAQQAVEPVKVAGALSGPEKAEATANAVAKALGAPPVVTGHEVPKDRKTREPCLVVIDGKQKAQGHRCKVTYSGYVGEPGFSHVSVDTGHHGDFSTWVGIAKTIEGEWTAEDGYVTDSGDHANEFDLGTVEKRDNCWINDRVKVCIGK